MNSRVSERFYLAETYHSALFFSAMTLAVFKNRARVATVHSECRKRKGEEMRRERPIINNSRNRTTRLANSKHLGKESDLLQEMAIY